MARKTKATIKDPVQVYRICIGWKIIYAVAMPAAAILFGLMVMPFLEGYVNELGLVVFWFFWGAGFMMALLDVFKGRIEVYPDRIKEVGLFETKEISIDEISGFRIISKDRGRWSVRKLILLPKNPKTKKTEIDLIRVERETDLLKWAKQKLTNLDAVDFQKEIKQILHDTRLGETKEQRIGALHRARNWSKLLNTLSFVLNLLAIFSPYPYGYITWALILLPLVALGSVRYFDGALELYGKEPNVLPNVAPVILMSCLGLPLRTFRDWNILNWDKFWFPFAAFSLSLFLLILMLAKDVRRKAGTAMLIFIFCTVYGHSSVISLNSILDISAPSIYRAQVIRKNRSRSNSCYLKLSSWGQRKTEKQVKVKESVYDRYGTEDEVEVVVRNGMLGIPWFYVR